ncbi:hypothetical protein BDZ91DRAFT_767356 [Kalaharituber pfeilii]|nr:hypothetical protein BDZ91DRAFT_767356 [Kalaharituber pfeilii]
MQFNIKRYLTLKQDAPTGGYQTRSLFGISSCSHLPSPAAPVPPAAVPLPFASSSPIPAKNLFATLTSTNSHGNNAGPYTGTLLPHSTSPMNIKVSNSRCAQVSDLKPTYVILQHHISPADGIKLLGRVVVDIKTPLAGYAPKGVVRCASIMGLDDEAATRSSDPEVQERHSLEDEGSVEMDLPITPSLLIFQNLPLTVSDSESMTMSHWSRYSWECQSMLTVLLGVKFQASNEWCQSYQLKSKMVRTVELCQHEVVWGALMDKQGPYRGAVMEIMKSHRGKLFFVVGVKIARDAEVEVGMEGRGWRGGGLEVDLGTGTGVRGSGTSGLRTVVGSGEGRREGWEERKERMAGDRAFAVEYREVKVRLKLEIERRESGCTKGKNKQRVFYERNERENAHLEIDASGHRTYSAYSILEGEGSRATQHMQDSAGLRKENPAVERVVSCVEALQRKVEEQAKELEALRMKQEKITMSTTENELQYRQPTPPGPQHYYPKELPPLPPSSSRISSYRTSFCEISPMPKPDSPSPLPSPQEKSEELPDPERKEYIYLHTPKPPSPMLTLYRGRLISGKTNSSMQTNFEFGDEHSLCGSPLLELPNTNVRGGSLRLVPSRCNNEYAFRHSQPLDPYHTHFPNSLAEQHREESGDDLHSYESGEDEGEFELELGEEVYVQELDSLW